MQILVDEAPSFGHSDQPATCWAANKSAVVVRAHEVSTDCLSPHRWSNPVFLSPSLITRTSHPPCLAARGCPLCMMTGGRAPTDRRGTYCAHSSSLWTARRRKTTKFAVPEGLPAADQGTAPDRVSAVVPTGGEQARQGEARPKRCSRPTRRDRGERQQVHQVRRSHRESTGSTAGVSQRGATQRIPESLVASLNFTPPAALEPGSHEGGCWVGGDGPNGFFAEWLAGCLPVLPPRVVSSSSFWCLRGHCWLTGCMTAGLRASRDSST
ncbi:hypothetical protein VFPFJ_03646 [Purpureocillium lilacinum]|uniref:Uncharacterized protein n=1 Tax=Purpureocillium lilacinum TaxID=33203 RepID=A0A179HNA3_PURLI|nr:hypothetical protein VFPFJ_03646 [Purpureocillium lilacinum]OAQ91906.1 hypothetical protein VFPFJ_03646 [Purpureocillium lilacinum]